MVKRDEKAPQQRKGSVVVLRDGRPGKSTKTADGRLVELARTRRGRSLSASSVIGAPSKSGPKPVPNPAVEPGWSPGSRVAFVVDRLGGVRPTAAMLDVSPTQVSRWARGERVPDGDQARRLIDLDHVIAHASLVWGAAAIPGWLTTPNGFLDGVRPIDWIAEHGTAEVIDALEAAAAGAYA
jgi:hypothetical protein